MPEIRTLIAVFYLALAGYYLFPEHYLLQWHPHEHHTGTCCSHHKEQSAANFEEKSLVCLEKEDHKQVFDLSLKLSVLDDFMAYSLAVFYFSGKYLPCFFDYCFVRGPPRQVWH